MKTIVASTFRAIAIVTSLFGLSAVVSARTPAPADPAAEQLARTGTVSVKTVGPYVEIGSFAIQVSAKLGRPTAVLPDGAWLYQNRLITESNATGTVVVRFKDGRVSDLSLVTPAVALAMRAPTKIQDKVMVATTK